MRILADNLSVSRGEDRIFEHISFQLEPSAALLVTGPNGVGKSTLMRVLAGFLPLDSGSLTCETTSGGDIAQNFAQYCHYIGHKNAMKDGLTVYENLKFWQNIMDGPNYHGEQKSMTPEAAAEHMRLAHTLELPYGILSQGQRRRIALAKLFIAYRPVWLLDEPTAALDKASAEHFAAHTNAYLQKGGIVIAATHDPLGLEQATTLQMEPAEMPSLFDEANI